MIEIAIHDIQKYDIKSIQEQIVLNINNDKYLLNPTIDGEQYILTLMKNQVEQPQKKRQAGSAKGQIWIADDFDKPLDCFKEYM